MYDKNLSILRSIINTIILCGKQNIPLRGHRDDSTSTASNKGNFHAILALLATTDENLREHLEVCKKKMQPTHLKLFTKK